MDERSDSGEVSPDSRARAVEMMELRRRVARTELRVTQLERGVVTVLAWAALAGLVIGAVMPWILSESTDEDGDTRMMTARLGLFAIQILADPTAEGEISILFVIAFGILTVTTLWALVSLLRILGGDTIGEGQALALTLLLVCCVIGAMIVTLWAVGEDPEVVRWTGPALWATGVALTLALLQSPRLREWTAAQRPDPR